MSHLKSLLNLVVVVWILTAVTSCKTVTAPTTAPNQPAKTWDARKTELSSLQSWRIDGKIAVTTAQDSGSASVDWAQRADSYTISLAGPLGTNRITLNGAPGHVTMLTSDGKKASAPSAEELLAKQWGWHLPVSYLKYWVRGLPVPGLAQTSRYDAYNRLASLSQQGFSIQYLNYTQKRNMDLPQLVAISSPSIKSKIVIHSWQIA